MQVHGVCTVYNAIHTTGDKVQDDTIYKRLTLSSQALVHSLRSDSAYVHSALTQGLEASIRLFACQGCDNYWWRKVPARKEVGRLLAVHGGCPWTYIYIGAWVVTHAQSIAFRHLPPNFARTGYAIEGALLISAHVQRRCKRPP